jgi:hypothetical protein
MQVVLGTFWIILPGGIKGWSLFPVQALWILWLSALGGMEKY